MKLSTAVLFISAVSAANATNIRGATTDRKLNIPTDSIDPPTDSIDPPTAITTDVLATATDELAPTTDVLATATDELAPTTDELAPATDELAPATDVLATATGDALEAVDVSWEACTATYGEDLVAAPLDSRRSLQSATASSHSHHAHGRVLSSSSSADEEEYHPTWQLLYGTNFICVDETVVTGKLVAPENIPVDAFLSSSSGDVDAVEGVTIMVGSQCDPDLERVKYTDAWCCANSPGEPISYALLVKRGVVVKQKIIFENWFPQDDVDSFPADYGRALEDVGGDVPPEPEADKWGPQQAIKDNESVTIVLERMPNGKCPKKMSPCNPMALADAFVEPVDPPSWEKCLAAFGSKMVAPPEAVAKLFG